MKKLWLSLGFALGVGALQAQDPALEWALQYGGQYSYDKARCVAMDPGGNVYVGLIYNGEMDEDPGDAEKKLLSASNDDIVIQKLDAKGTLVWSKHFGGTGQDDILDLIVDASGNLYALGIFEATVDIDPGDGVTNLTTAGYNDIFLQKFDPKGNLLWAKHFGGAGGDRGHALSFDATGNVIVVGTFAMTVDLDPGKEVKNFTTTNYGDIFIEKLDPNGTLLWVKQFGGSRFEYVNGIVVDAQNSIFLVGFFTKDCDFDPSAAELKVMAASDSRDAFVLKLTADGALTWVKTFGGYENESAECIALDAAGNLIIGGSFEGSVDVDPGAGQKNLSALTESDGFILKLDGQGAFLAAYQFGGYKTESIRFVALDKVGNICFVGNANGAVDLDPGDASTMGNTTGIFVGKLTADGKFLSGKQAEGKGYTYYHDAVYQNGTLVVVGNFRGTPDFDFTAGAKILTPKNDDGFVAKWKY